MTVIAPEDLNPFSLPSLPLRTRQQLPECTATYLVLDSDTKVVLYIGVTKNLLRRWKSHNKLSYMPHSALIAWLEVENLNIARAVEYRLIQKFNPVFNNYYNPVPPNPIGIRILRQKSGVSFKEVSSATQIHIKTLEAWERGGIIPILTVEQIAIICELYNCTISELRVAAKESLENPWHSDWFKEYVKRNNAIISGNYLG